MINLSADILARLAADPLVTLASVLADEPSGMVGHDDYAFHAKDEPSAEPSVEAAVLLPLIPRPDGLHVLFTRRTEHLARHSGQVSFPGGRREKSDLSPRETALRETMEETGIAPEFVRIAGYLPRFRTGTGFDILPVVGLLSPGFSLVPDPHEVAEIFEAKLAFFLDPANRREETRELGGRARRFHVFEPDGHYIWGATAAILADFAARLRGLENVMTSP